MLFRLLRRIMAAIITPSSNDDLKPFSIYSDGPDATNREHRVDAFYRNVTEADLRCSVESLTLLKSHQSVEHESVAVVVSFPGQSGSTTILFDRTHSDNLERTNRPVASRSTSYFAMSPPSSDTSVRSSIDLSNEVSGSDYSSDALDRVCFPPKRDFRNASWRHILNNSSQYCEMYTIRFPGNHPTIVDLAVVLQMVSKAWRRYSYRRFCYDYAAMVCEIMLAKFEGDLQQGPGASRVTSRRLLGGTSTRVVYDCPPRNENPSLVEEGRRGELGQNAGLGVEEPNRISPGYLHSKWRLTNSDSQAFQSSLQGFCSQFEKKLEEKTEEISRLSRERHERENAEQLAEQRRQKLEEERRKNDKAQRKIQRLEERLREYELKAGQGMIATSSSS